jgi:hypothetical protein
MLTQMAIDAHREEDAQTHEQILREQQEAGR